jgi:phage tail sheath protein FI
MAEQIISPGVFQNENVPVALEAAAAPIGAAIIGPATKGPINIPTTVTTYTDYVTKFGAGIVSGGIEYSYFTGISAQNYFKQGGTNLTVIRVVSASEHWTTADSTAIISGSDGGDLSPNNVFTLSTISAGANQNSDSTETTGNALPSGSSDNLRWEITNVDSGSGIFTLNIRQGNDRQADKTILESWRGVSLDPKRDDYISKVIGNQTFAIGTDGDDSYVSITGEYPNNSKYVIVKDVLAPTPDYLDGAGNFKPQFTSSLPAAQSGAFDSGTGDNITTLAGGTTFYKDIAAGNSQGLIAKDYTASVNLLKNKDQYAFNVISTPGLVYEFTTATDGVSHKTVLDDIITNTTTRGDSILPIDIVAYDSTTAEAITQAGLLNTNYAAAYWPWLLVKDENTSANVWCPASTVIPSVYVFNDNTSEAWFAPAGFTRGTMPNVVAPEKTLPRGLRDNLYTAKINPIATFPGTGVVVYGQKTLQSLSTALDRVNVRRLMIALKAFIGNVSQNLVFEPNTLQTRNSFLSVVNPYLESVQQNQGLYAFKVVMDDSNNGPDVIDRQELRGAIYLQPVKTAEFIVLDFNLLPTGAEFPA